ncbi:GNAT family N-acetyltransferase [Jannaschia sp. Os4]|uniref:GNAT family N-acyltransferase n=1 Tax=Jannaschia sp. Os4 TaxID=2807617 RepID=UPI00193A0E0D|nr:GNAT family N-acyltransferase [Jannaschia sp. Os4]MBM2577858.1 GNAT family N-acetyltransferase [Jannaschia sp. Os4]
MGSAKALETPVEMQVGGWRVTTGPGAEADALALRASVFRGGRADRDAFDDAATHLAISDAAGPAACARLMVLRGSAIASGYTGQSYDLAAFAARFPVALEVGRVALAPERRAPDLPRLLLAVLARVVLDEGAAALFGCASFPGAHPQPGALAALRTEIAPDAWRPAPRAPETVAIADLPDAPPAPLPPMLRGYLAMGACISDHAVIDRDLGTTHVFAGLPVADIPAPRRRLLAALLEPA